MIRRSLLAPERARGVTAVLGPTNTGKTHLAIERLVAHSSGIIGLPLRLLAREVYGRVVEKVGADAVALVTGEEKIKPDRARYWIATVEAMPRDIDVAFVAIDEIQLASDLHRGHVFTDRMLHQRGREETLLIGSQTMRPIVEALLPGIHVVTRPRLSNLTFAGDRKISRLPPRSAIVAFSAEEVYAIAELIRRQRGGAAVVLGALSPRTRNAQVELYQAGDVDYLVATDAVGMGLNLDVGHVAFASRSKFDGFQFRDLNPAELAQIAGRAGRHMRDGTFGSTGRSDPFDPETIDRLENHRFEPIKVLQWRNADLDLRTLPGLLATLGEIPSEAGLTRALSADDEAALAILARDDEIRSLATTRDQVIKLWDACSLPDYRKISPANHADLVGTIYRYVAGGGKVPADWLARHVAIVDRTDGDIDALSHRLSEVRIWAFVANHPDWVADPQHWQGVTRRVEDTLSDALHARLAIRFVDRRTSVLMRRLRENATMEAEITPTGDVSVEGQHVGHLLGFHFVPDPGATGEEAKALRNAAGKALASEIEARAERFSATPDASLVLSNDGTVRWTGDPVARLEPGDAMLDPQLRILADEQLTGPARDKVDLRLKNWLKAHIVRLLGGILDLGSGAELQGLARGIAFQISELLGILERARIAKDLRSLDQAGRAALRAKGVRFGAYHVYLPALVKPGPRILAAQLWALKNGGLDQKGIGELAHLAGSGRTSMTVEPDIAKGLYRAAGFRVCGARAVRIDILERLADLIRPAIAYRPGVTPGEPPPGAADGEGFVQTPAMTSLVGTSGEDFGSILRSLSYVSDQRPGPAITVPLLAARERPTPKPTPEERTTVPETGTAAEGVPAPSETSLESGGDGESPADMPDPGIQDASDEPAAGPLADPSLESAADRILAASNETEPRDVEAVLPPEASAIAEDRDAADAPDPDTQEGHDELAAAEADQAPRAALRPDDLAQAAFAHQPDAIAEDDTGTASEVGDPVSAETEPVAAQVMETPAADVDPVVPISESDADLLDLDQAARAGSGEVSLSAAIAHPAEMVSAPTEPAASAEEDALPIAAAEPEAPSEPATIEVWRLHHVHREHRAPPRQRHRPDQRGPRREPQRDEAPRPGIAAQERPRRPDRPDAAAARTRDDRRPPREGRRDERPRPERPRFEDRRPERRERAPDPNSPFAALAGLKAQLEAQDRDKR